MLPVHIVYICRCKGLILLETYTTKSSGRLKLPEFLEIKKEVTEDPYYSMFNLSLKDTLTGSPSKLKPITNSIDNTGKDVESK